MLKNTKSHGNTTVLERQWEAFELSKAGRNPAWSVCMNFMIDRQWQDLRRNVAVTLTESKT